jgi:hypothetical protein
MDVGDYGLTGSERECYTRYINNSMRYNYELQ